MQTLEKRISALERVSYSNTDDVMFIHFVALGEVDKEIQRITHGGQEWQRQPDESEQALKDRAQLGAKPNPHGVTVFLCHCAPALGAEIARLEEAGRTAGVGFLRDPALVAP